MRAPTSMLSNEKYIDELTVDEKETLRDKKAVAIDPNLSDLIYCIDGSDTTFRYTQNQRRKETKAKKYRDILQQNKRSTKIDGKSINEWEAELSHHNKKTLDFDALQTYIELKNKMNAALSGFYEEYIYRKLKLSGFINRKKSEQRMLSRFKQMFGSPEDVVIGFGDFEQAKHRKFKEPVRGRGFRSLFRKSGYQVYLVDEFRTSCKCSACEGECSTFRECVNPRPWRRESRPVVIRHGLVKCKTCARLWNRDTNASRNIYKIMTNELLGIDRPEYLSRASGSFSGATSASA
jgi:transposase